MAKFNIYYFKHENAKILNFIPFRLYDLTFKI